MNERIKELAEQAEKQVRVTVKSDMGFVGFEIDEDEFRRVFAELIIKDLCDTVVQPYMSRWPEDCPLVIEIKEHFGVK